MSFTAVGSIIKTDVSTVSLSPQTVGNLIVLEVLTDNSATCTSISGGGCSWTLLGTIIDGSVNGGSEATVFTGTVSTTGSATATLSFNGTPATIRAAGQEFHSSVGTWTLDQQGTLDSSGTSALPSLTPAQSGELYFGFFFDSNANVAGSTSGYTYGVDSHNNGVAFNPSCSGSTQSPTMGDANNTFGLSVLIREGSNFTAVGDIIQADTSSLSLSPKNIGDLIVLEVLTDNSAPCTSISGGGCTWTLASATATGIVNGGRKAAVFFGAVTATGSATATLSFSGTPSNIRAAGQEFRTPTNNWTLDQQGTLDSSGTDTLPSLTPVRSGELYFGYFFNSGAVWIGTTTSYSYNEDIHNNGMLFNTFCSGSMQSPTMRDTTNSFGLAVIVQTPTVANTAFLKFP
ncbi:MAG TPA: hypothetical protein VLG92_00520 [Candidatus Saccharimonadia bacterium]|nr:hypothetical protein [Candidatus Saccharimonadia bacterium]